MAFVVKSRPSTPRRSPSFTIEICSQKETKPERSSLLAILAQKLFRQQSRPSTPRRPPSFTIEIRSQKETKRSSSLPNGNSRGSGNRSESSDKVYTPEQVFHHGVNDIYKSVAKNAKVTTKKAWGNRYDLTADEKAEVLEEHAKLTMEAAAKVRQLGAKLDADMAAKAATKAEKAATKAAAKAEKAATKAEKAVAKAAAKAEKAATK